jgi:hypothetical protein
MKFGDSRSTPADIRRLLRGILLAAPLSLALWAVIGAATLHALPAHSRHAISWRLHAVAWHVVGQYRAALA